jgi:hypothetical protein
MITNDMTYLQAHTRVARVKELVGFLCVDGICAWHTELLNSNLRFMVPCIIK